MDLWIRSQDKERLIKPVDFYIEEIIDYVNKSSEFNIYALNFANDDIIIGTYQTKERALEVFDEIQRKIEKLYALENCSLEKNSCIEKSLVIDNFNIYQMPEE